MNKKLFKGALVLFASILMTVSCSNNNTNPEDSNKEQGSNTETQKKDFPTITGVGTSVAPLDEVITTDGDNTKTITYTGANVLTKAVYSIVSASKVAGDLGTVDSLSAADFSINASTGAITLKKATADKVNAGSSNYVTAKIVVKITSTSHKDGTVEVFIKYKDQ